MEEEFNVPRHPSPKNEASSKALVTDLISKLELVGKLGPRLMDDIPLGMKQRLDRALSLAKAASRDHLLSVHHALSLNATASVQKILADLGILQTLAARKEAKFTTMALNLSTEVGSHMHLLFRLLPYAASVGLISEPEPQTWQANALTCALARQSGIGAINYGFNMLDIIWNILPHALAKNEYQDPASMMQTPFQIAHGKTSPHEWLAKRPALQKSDVKFTTKQSELLGNWIGNKDVESTIIDFEDLLSKPTERALFVDVAGGVGHQCAALLKGHPKMAKKIVIQEDGFTIRQAMDINPYILGQNKVEPMTIDLFEGQPVLGAKLYHMRHTLMYYSNNQCMVVLGHIVDAMALDSRLVIDELLLHEPSDIGGGAFTGSSLVLSQLDLIMMLLGGMLRTKKQWIEMLSNVGLIVESFHPYGEKANNAHVLIAKKG